MLRRAIRFSVTWFPALMTLGWLQVFVLNRSLARKLVDEDSLLQWLQFLFLILTAACCLRTVLGCGRIRCSRLVRAGFLVFAILALLVALEEISWGQRVFGLKTPESLDRVNVQGEITLHNLGAFQPYRHWMLILFGAGGLVLILLRSRGRSILRAFAPPVFFWLAFGLILLNGLAYEMTPSLAALVPGSQTRMLLRSASRFNEIGELCVTVTAFAYALHKSIEFKRDRDPKEACD